MRPVIARQSYVDSGFRQIEDYIFRLMDRVEKLERELETERRLRLAMRK